MGERRARLLAAALLALVLATLSVPRATAAGDADADAGTLDDHRSVVGTDGRWLVDGHGRTIYVHGLQIAHKTAPYHPPAGSLTRADARLIKRLGINAVRLAWFWKGLEPERDHIDRAYLDEILREVDLLTSHGIWVLLELHQDNYNEAVHGAGFPDWATFTDGLPNPGADTPGGAYVNNPAMQRAFDNLYADREGIRSEMSEAWRTVARAVVRSGAGNERLLGYDLFNEPWPGNAYPTCTPPLGCPIFDTTVLQPLQDELALAVRSVDQETPVFYEPHLLADFGSPSYLAAPPAGVGPVAFGFHDYCFSSLVTKQPDGESDSAGYPACPVLDEQVYVQAERAATRMDAAIVQTEFGDTQDLAELERVMQLADSHLTGWMLWGYKDWVDYPGGIGDGDMFDDPDDLSTLRQPMADVVSRPVPQLVSGTPTHYAYDPTSGRMELEWTPRPGVDAATVVFVPVARHYPEGYQVTVEGGKVVSPPGATRLRVRNTGGPVRVRLARDS
jgi:endoglycosylceramidase